MEVNLIGGTKSLLDVGALTGMGRADEGGVLASGTQECLCEGSGTSAGTYQKGKGPDSWLEYFCVYIS